MKAEDVAGETSGHNLSKNSFILFCKDFKPFCRISIATRMNVSLRSLVNELSDNLCSTTKLLSASISLSFETVSNFFAHNTTFHN